MEKSSFFIFLITSAVVFLLSARIFRKAIRGQKESQMGLETFQKRQIQNLQTESQTKIQDFLSLMQTSRKYLESQKNQLQAQERSVMERDLIRIEDLFQKTQSDFKRFLEESPTNSQNQMLFRKELKHCQERLASIETLLKHWNEKISQ